MKTLIFNGWAFKNSVWNSLLDRLGLHDYQFYNEKTTDFEADIYFSWSLGFLRMLQHFDKLNTQSLFISFSPTFSFISREGYIAVPASELNLMFNNIEKSPKAVLRSFHNKCCSHLSMDSYENDIKKLKNGLIELKEFNFLNKELKLGKNFNLFAASRDKIIGLEQSEYISKKLGIELKTFNSQNHSFFLEDTFFYDIQKQIKITF